MRTLGAFACVLAVTVVQGAAQTRGVTAEDYLSFEFVADPHFSPDGSTVAYVMTTIDRKQNRRHSDIWTVPADGSRDATALTASPQSSNSPRWSPDGRTMAFLTARPAGPMLPRRRRAWTTSINPWPSATR